MFMLLFCTVCVILQPCLGGTLPTVSNLNVVVINSTALSVSWSGPNIQEIQNYSVTVSSAAPSTSVTVDINSGIGVLPNYIDQIVVFIGLFPYTDYDIQVKGEYTTGIRVLDIPTAMTSVRTAEGAPGPPRLSSATAQSPTQIRVAWLAPPPLEQNGPIVRFLIDFSNDIITGPYNQTFDTALSYPISLIAEFAMVFTVEEAITYNITVAAINGAGIGSASPSIVATTGPAAPPNVVPFAASEIVVLSETPTSINFSVPIVSIVFLNGPLLGYTIGYVGSLLSSALFEFTNSPNSTLDTTSVLSVDVAAGSGIVILDLQPNYLYTWNISVRNGVGSTLPQTITRKSPSALPSGAPINIALTVVSHQTMNVSWSINLTTVNGQLRSFNVNYSAPGYSNSVVYSPINSTGPYQLSLTGLAGSTLYSVRVSVVNSVGEGMQSSAVTAETLLTPRVSNLNAAAINSTALNVTWSAPNIGAVVLNYSVTVSSAARSTSVTVVINSGIGVFPNYVDQIVVFGGLFPYTDYDIHVNGTYFSGLTPRQLSSVVTSVRTPEAAPGPPRLSSATPQSPTQIRVVWLAPLDTVQNGPIVRFLIDFSNDIITGPYNQTFDTALSYPISLIAEFEMDFTVEEAITYNITVAAINGAGIGSVSPSIVATTGPAAPPNVVPFAASEIVVLSQTPTAINFSVPIVSIVFLNGPLVGYTIGYVGSLLSSALFEFTNSPNSTLDTTSVLSVDVAAGSGIVILDLQPNYLYTWNISVRNGVGSTLPQTITRKSPSALPSGAPINIALTVVSHQTINVSWSINLTTVNGQLRSFNVNYSAPGYSNSVVYSPINSTGPYQLSLTGLAGSTLYSVRVSVVNSVGEGMQSSAVTAETLLTPRVSNLSAVAINSTALNLTWSGPNIGAVQNYSVTVSSAARSTSVTVDINSGIGVFPNYVDQIVVFGGLFPYTDYDIQVNGTYLSGLTPRQLSSVVTSVRTAEAVPTPTQSSTTVQVTIPTQRLFPTANIAVIYVIADFSSPSVFSSYSLTQRYNSVSSIFDGAILVDGAPTIRVQALLGDAYFNQLPNYFTYTVGSGGTTIYNGISVNNVPLDPGTSYEISVYVLFYNGTGQTAPHFSFFNVLFPTVTPQPLPKYDCLICILIPLCAFVLVVFLVLVILIALFYYYMWDAREKRLTPPRTEVSPEKEEVKAKDSLHFKNREADNPPLAESEVADTKV